MRTDCVFLPAFGRQVEGAPLLEELLSSAALGLHTLAAPALQRLAWSADVPESSELPAAA